MIDCTAEYPSHSLPPSPTNPCVRPMGHGGLHRAFDVDGEGLIRVYEFTHDLKYVGGRAITPAEQESLVEEDWGVSPWRATVGDAAAADRLEALLPPEESEQP